MQGKAIPQLTRRVASPGPDRAIALQSQTVGRACGNSDDIGQSYHLYRSKTRRLRSVAQFSFDVSSPGPDRAIRLQSQTVGVGVIDTCSNSSDVGQSPHLYRSGTRRLRSIAQLPRVIPSPGPDRTIRL